MIVPEVRIWRVSVHEVGKLPPVLEQISWSVQLMLLEPFIWKVPIENVLAVTHSVYYGIWIFEFRFVEFLMTERVDLLYKLSYSGETGRAMPSCVRELNADRIHSK